MIIFRFEIKGLLLIEGLEQEFLCKETREDFDTTIIDNEFENTDVFEKCWHEFASRYSDIKCGLVIAAQRKEMIRSRVLAEREGRRSEQGDSDEEKEEDDEDDEFEEEEDVRETKVMI
jgi:hypothetical protein